MKLRGKLALFVFVPLAVILVIVVRVDLTHTRSRAIDSAKLRLKATISDAAARLDGQFQRIAQIADTAAIAVADSDEWTTKELLGLSHSIVARDSIIIGFGVAWETDASPIPGKPYLGFAQRLESGVTESNLADRFDYLTNEYYERVRTTRQPIWSLPFFDHVATGTEVVTYLSPVVEDNIFRGVVAVDIGARTFESLASRIGLGDRPWLILDQAGKAIAASPEGAQRIADRDQVSGTSLEEILKTAGLRPGSETGLLERLDQVDELVDTVYPVPEPDEVDPQPRVAAIARVNSTGWLLITGTELSVITAVADELVRGRAIRAGSIVLISLAVVVAGAWWTVLRPVRRLSATVTEVARGRTEARSDLKGRDELAMLGKALDDAIPKLEAFSRTEASMASAREIQTSLLPTGPIDVDGVAMAGRVESSDETGGDFFDFGRHVDGKIGVVIGDATGHGLPAAIFVATARAYVRALARHWNEIGPALEESNDRLVEDASSGLFLVLFMAWFDLESRSLHLGTAGHPGWIMRPGADRYEMIEATGIPLGIEAQSFPARVLDDIESGTLLFLASDGAWEVRNPAGDMLGIDGLIAHAATLRSLPPVDQVEQLFSFIHEFAGDRPLEDDCTIVVSRF